MDYIFIDYNIIDDTSPIISEAREVSVSSTIWKACCSVKYDHIIVPYKFKQSFTVSIRRLVVTDAYFHDMWVPFVSDISVCVC